MNWNRVPGRSAELASALDGVAWSVHPSWLSGRRRAPLRYIVCAIVTVARLVVHRPRAVIVTNPPIFPATIVWLYSRITGARTVLDSHPGAFGLKDDRVGELMLPVHRFLARRAESTIVAGEALAERVRSWGGRADVVHEAPPVQPLAPARPGPDGKTVLYVCIFAPDDPVHEVLEALSGLDEISLRVTGQPPLGFDVGRYPGVEFTGYLRGPRYREALERADIVLSLTTEPTSAVRVGFEAVFGRRPLVVSDWPLLREAFPYAVHVENTAPGIRRGILRAVEDWEDLARDADRALEVTERRWSEQLGVLRRRLGLDDGGASRRGPAAAPSGAIAGG